MARSMYERYGGFGRLSRLVTTFYDKILDSDIVGPYFEDVDLARLVDHQTKFLAAIMGRPASYTDEALHQTHARLAVTDAVFDEVVWLLRDSLDEFGVSAADARVVVAAFEARRTVIVAGAGRTEP
jgi:hemoglobin